MNKYQNIKKTLIGANKRREMIVECIPCPTVLQQVKLICRLLLSLSPAVFSSTTTRAFIFLLKPVSARDVMVCWESISQIGSALNTLCFDRLICLRNAMLSQGSNCNITTGRFSIKQMFLYINMYQVFHLK